MKREKKKHSPDDATTTNDGEQEEDEEGHDIKAAIRLMKYAAKTSVKLGSMMEVKDKEDAVVS